MNKKIYKVLSIILTLAVILSTCLCAIGTVSAEEATYYVSAAGNDETGTGTSDAPFATLNKAVTVAVDAGYDADDTVYVKTIGADAVQTGLTNKAALPAHAFKLVITANDTAVPGTIAGDFELGGKTEFTHVTITGIFHFGGESAILGEGAVLSGNNGTYVGQYSNIANHVNTTAPVDIKINSLKHMSLHLMGSFYNNAVYNYPVTVEVDDWQANYRNEVHGGIFLSNANCSATFNAPLNLKIDKSNIRLVFKSTTSKLKLGENFALQVINSTGKAIAKTGDTLTREDSLTATHTNALDNIDSSKKYILTNNSSLPDILTFTDTVGKFAVTDARYTITATPATGEPIVSVDGFLTVPAGEYTITAAKTPEIVTYYIASAQDGGSSDNDGLTAQTPLLTVANAIGKANAYGVLTPDTLLIKVVGTTANATWGTDLKCNAGIIRIISNDLQNLSTIVPPDITVSTEMGGIVEYDNIKIQGVAAPGNPDKFIANGRSVTVGENAIIVNANTALYPTHQLTTINNTLTYTVKNAFKGMLYLSHWNNNGITYKGDLNYIVDNPAATPTFKVATAYNTASANKINGNLNIVIYDAASVTFENKGTKGNPYYTISGALQVITPASIKADITNLATIGQNDSAPQGGVYHIINDTGVAHAVELTDTVGTYKINYTDAEKETFLVDEDGNTTRIENGQITVEPGVYTVIAVGDYLNDTEKITVYEDCEIDLSAETHKQKDNKVFIGWQKSDGSWAELKETHNAGEVLTAKYIDLSDSDFEVNNYNLTNDDELKLNFGFNITDAINNIPNISEKGMIWVPTDVALGREIRVDEKIVKQWTWDANDKNKFIPNSTLDAPEKFANSNLASIAISEDEYDKYYTTRGYIKYVDNNGVQGIVYTAEEGISAYKVAMEATDSKPFYNTIIEKVKADNKEYLDGINETVVAVYDKENTALKRNTDSYDVFSTIEGAGDFVKYKREVVLTNTGVKEAVDLGWLTDMHIFNVSQTDVDRKVTNILSTYRGSSWLRVYPILNRADNQIKYATKRYNKTIITGDIADNYSYGMYSSIKQLVSDKSVNGSILMTTGNHEFAEHVNADIKGLPNQFTAAEKYELIAKTYTTDPTYYAEILKTSKGEDNAMVILLDNGSQNGYYEGTAEKLQASIEIARQKNIPILIFQHIPMSTYNETEKKVYKPASITTLGLGTEESNGGTTNMYSYHNKGADVQEIIRKNYDVIKGVFCGHDHRNYYSEITALDEEGNIIPDKFIPQFVGGAADYESYWANEITLEGPCAHEYDDCEDTVCNLCDEERIASGHSFTNYVANGDATCQKLETETASCDYGCGETDTRDIPDSYADHKYTDASDASCDFECGYNRPLGKQLVEEGGEKYYYLDGVKQVEVTDLVWIDGVWYYIEEGRWASDIDTLHKINGKWFLVKGGIWNKTTGLEEYKGKTFYVSGGKWDASVTDLKKVDGVWYYIQYGKWNNTIDTLHKINGKWFLIKKGIWNKTTGLVEYKGKTFYVSGGKWNSSVNTLYKKGSKYYAIKSGKLYEGKTIITYSGKKFYCNKGYAQLSFSGKVKIGTKTYTIKAGKVV